MPRKRIILAARYYPIESVGFHYLAGLVREAGWDLKIVLVRGTDFDPLYAEVATWKPDIVGLQIWTGYHIPAFAACDRIRARGVPVVIGGPHATYFHEECNRHADWTIVATGFAGLDLMLAEKLPHGVYFEPKDRAVPFPLPHRDVMYDAYPELAASPIKSIFGSVGCPYTCTYCYAPTFNEMHGGFKLTTRSVDDLVAEAKDLMRWPTQMIYFQDDIFGFDTKWLAEFARKWKAEVGLPFHCQIRLELTQKSSGDLRLDLFKEAGCTGITLAIESGDAFLRDHVLFRHMDHELIVEGCRKILDRGMTLRTEQILAVPFSSTDTDLATLALNNEINPTMTWTSILAPFGGTDMGTIAKKFRFYEGNNDDLAETFFDRSVLRHVSGGPRDIAQIVSELGAGPRNHVLLRLQAEEPINGSARVSDEKGVVVGSIRYLSPYENEKYCEDTVRLQRLFMTLAKFPQAEALGRKLVALPTTKWTWRSIGSVTEEHLREHYGDRLGEALREFALRMGYTSWRDAPSAIRDNPWAFMVYPAPEELAQLVIEKRVFVAFKSINESLDEFGTLSRRHLFEHGLYRIRSGSEPLLAL